MYFSHNRRGTMGNCGVCRMSASPPYQHFAVYRILLIKQIHHAVNTYENCNQTHALDQAVVTLARETESQYKRSVVRYRAGGWPWERSAVTCVCATARVDLCSVEFLATYEVRIRRDKKEWLAWHWFNHLTESSSSYWALCGAYGNSERIHVTEKRLKG
jgi:hypothetical protein